MSNTSATMARSNVLAICKANNHIYNDQTGECVDCQIEMNHRFLKVAMNFLDTLVKRGRELSFDDRLLLLSELVTAFQFKIARPSSTVLYDATLSVESDSIGIKSPDYNFCVIDMGGGQ